MSNEIIKNYFSFYINPTIPPRKFIFKKKKKTKLKFAHVGISVDTAFLPLTTRAPIPQ